VVWRGTVDIYAVENMLTLARRLCIPSGLQSAAFSGRSVRGKLGGTSCY
jgi:hypothetical protein